MSVILLPGDDVYNLLKRSECLLKETKLLLESTNKMVEENTSCNVRQSDWTTTPYICKKIFSFKDTLDEVEWDKIIMAFYKDGSMKIVFIEINMNRKTKIDLFDKNKGYFIKIKKTCEYLKQLLIKPIKYHHPKIKIQQSILGVLKCDPIFMYLTHI